MKPEIKRAICAAVENEPMAKTLHMKLLDLQDGCSTVEMIYAPETMDNIYQRAHGGAIFSLIDEAFETASQTDGTIAVALNVNVSYIASPESGDKLIARARRVNQTHKSANYEIRVTNQTERLIATCQAVAYRTGKTIPFL